METQLTLMEVDVMIVWGIVLFVVISLLIFGYLVDKKTDRYKEMSDKEMKQGIEQIKDKAEKMNPPNSNRIDYW